MTPSSPSAPIIDLPKSDSRLDAIVCLSHLRWEFVFQRPQHLMSRFARSRTVIYFEEPLPSEAGQGVGIDVRRCPDTDVVVVTPRLPAGLDGPCAVAVLRQLLDETFLVEAVTRPVLWYYTPMMLPVARHIEAAATVYDCMDELANFKFAPPELIGLERELFAQADMVFTGGHSLYEAKADRHANIHPFPSSVDRDHFARATAREDVGRPRLGFFGVIDERMDLDLMAALAEARPDCDFEIVGPVVKIDPADLPKTPNLTYPGQAAYDDLPNWLSRWDVALMPFAINESTRFISPTKTPEYLAAGRPVVSTPIRDVVRHYGDLDAVFVAETTEAFIAACDQAVALARGADSDWREDVEAELASLSWTRPTCVWTPSSIRRRVGASPLSRHPRCGRQSAARTTTPWSSARASPVPSWPSAWPRRVRKCWLWIVGLTSRATPMTISMRPGC